MKAKWAMPLAIVLGAAALIGGTGLTVSSAWLITMAAQHPPILVLGVSIVLVRFFGISRSAARYGERVISHEAIFLKLSSIRREIFTALAGRLNKEDIAGNVKSAIDDVERAQEYYLRITLPQFAAAISGATVFLIAYWIEPSYLFVVIPLLFIYAVLIPLLTHRLIDPIALLLEDGESDYARSIGAASQASIEAEVYGYGELLRKQLHDATESLRQAEAILYKRISALQAIAIFSLGAALVDRYGSDTRKMQYLPLMSRCLYSCFLWDSRVTQLGFPIYLLQERIEEQLSESMNSEHCLKVNQQVM